MACGCNKNRNTNLNRNFRPANVPRNNGLIAAAPVVRNLSTPSPNPNSPQVRNLSTLNPKNPDDKKKIQSIRREAILKAFGK
ncbi:MAG: hypothetical protein EKK64_03615 [Neisseriaceae bacterium]|nr:MAG: hypothetical protein EKK64_03615 [Neisseriaceae bacterium]